jgi:hypothetical protein
VTDLIEDHTFLSVVVGSRAYGLQGPGSDHDRRGVYAEKGGPVGDSRRLRCDGALCA